MILLDRRLDSALIGVGQTPAGISRAVYSKRAILTILVESGVTGDDLTEYYHWRIASLPVNELAPIVFDDTDTEDD